MIVHYVQNFTDIDDKILNRDRAEATTMAALSERYTQRYFEDMRRLTIREADDYPRVTEHIDAIHELIGPIEVKGYAYAAGALAVLWEENCLVHAGQTQASPDVLGKPWYTWPRYWS